MEKWPVAGQARRSHVKVKTERALVPADAVVLTCPLNVFQPWANRVAPGLGRGRPDPERMDGGVWQWIFQSTNLNPWLDQDGSRATPGRPALCSSWRACSWKRKRRARCSAGEQLFFFPIMNITTCGRHGSAGADGHPSGHGFGNLASVSEMHATVDGFPCQPV